MPEEIEVPTEKLHETIKEEAEKAREKWILLVALSTAVLAVFAALCSLMAGHHANEALIEQIQASDQWAYYQAKGIKAAVLESKVETLQALGKQISAMDEEKIRRYKKEQREIEERASAKEKASSIHLVTHNTLSKAVTVFQIAIAVSAISVLTRRKWLWAGSGVLGLTGLIFLIQALL
jgi:translation initiation factor 2B subunit (eIF-2B alpha/beta/delta family)